MNNCELYLELISAYADNELSAADIERVKAHLNECENCASLLSIYQEISTVITDDIVPAPPVLCNSVMQRVHSVEAIRAINSTRKRKHFRYIMAALAPIAACLAIVLLILPQFNNIDRSRNEALRDDAAMSNLQTETAMPAMVAPPAMSPAESPTTTAEDPNEIGEINMGFENESTSDAHNVPEAPKASPPGDNDAGAILPPPSGAETGGGEMYPFGLAGDDADVDGGGDSLSDDIERRWSDGSIVNRWLVRYYEAISEGYYALILMTSDLPVPIPEISLRDDGFSIITSEVAGELIDNYIDFVALLFYNDSNARHALVMLIHD